MHPALAGIAAALHVQSAGSSMAVAAVSAAQSQLKAAPFQVVAAARTIAPDSSAPVIALSGEQLQAFAAHRAAAGRTSSWTRPWHRR